MRFCFYFTKSAHILIFSLACDKIQIKRGVFMKIGLFSDLHFCQSDNLGLGRAPRLGIERLRVAVKGFKSAGVEMIICLGDLTDRVEGDSKEDTLINLREVLSVIGDIPFYLVSGNHDFLNLSRADMASEGVLLSPFCIRGESAHIIGLDANFRADMRHFDEAGEKWDDAHIPPSQLEMLDNELEASDVPCVVLIHENLDPCVDFSHQVRNAPEVREVIANHANKVKSVIQGHFHYGAQGVYDGVEYQTLKSICVFDEDFYKIIEL